MVVRGAGRKGGEGGAGWLTDEVQQRSRMGQGITSEMGDQISKLDFGNLQPS